jgi:hypothetical protein
MATDTSLRSTLVPRLARLLPAAIIPPLAVAMALSDGQYGSTWYPAALAIVAAFVVFATAGPRRALSRVQVIALSAAGGLAGWMYLSLLWSELGGPTLTEANRAATYALALALVVLVGDTPERRRDLLVVTAGASAVLALYVAVRLVNSPSLELFAGDRLFRPIGYPNALSAFLMMGLWPLVMLAASPDEPVALRGVALMGAAAIPATALLTVSRAGMLFALLGTVVYFAVSPIRVRSLLAATIAVAPVLAGFSTLDDVQHGATADTTQAAGRVIVTGAVIGFAAGIAWGVLERRTILPSTIGRALRLILVGAVLVGVVGGVVVAVQRDASGFTQRRWDAFRAGQGSDAGEEQNRLLTSGSNRYDFWRVSLDMLQERPLTGYGAANWQWKYLSMGKSGEEPNNAHGSIWEFAAGLGVVGVALYLTAMLLAIGAAFVPATTGDGPRSAALLAAMAIGVGHMQVDWLWETPATGLLAMCICGLSLAGLRRPERPVRMPLRHVSLGLAIAVGVIGILPALLSERYTDASYDASPSAGLRLAERGATLNPFSASPEMARAAAAKRAGQGAVVVTALRSASDREPKNWAAWALLGEAQRSLGDASAGLRSCVEAQHIKPTVVCPGQSS